MRHPSETSLPYPSFTRFVQYVIVAPGHRRRKRNHTTRRGAPGLSPPHRVYTQTTNNTMSRHDASSSTTSTAASPSALETPRFPLLDLTSRFQDYMSTTTTAPTTTTTPTDQRRPTPHPTIPTTTYNTTHLPARLLSDLLAASAAGLTVSPIISIIDRAIMENASNTAPLLTSVRTSLASLLSAPHRFLAAAPFRLIFCLYTGTYLAANALDTASATLHNAPATSVTAGPAKFAATSAANISLCLYKDARFTRMFGVAAAVPRAVPAPTYALFAARDCLTVAASFNIPPLLAPVLPLSRRAEAYMSRASAAQFLAPAAVQLLSTPLHLLGLDLYNRPGAGVAGVDGRAARVWRDWGKSVAARVCRIVPAFGVGGVVNAGVRRRLMARVE